MKKLFVLVVVFLFLMVPVVQAQGPYQPYQPWAQQAVSNFNYGVASIAGNSYVAGQWGYNQAYNWGHNTYQELSYGVCKVQYELNTWDSQLYNELIGQGW